MSGEKSISRFAGLADHLIAVEPDEELVMAWDQEKGGTSSRKIGQIPICWDPDEKRAIERAHQQFRWFGGGWAVNADLPTPAGFEGASQFVRPEDIAEQIPCGPDLDKIVEAVQPFQQLGLPTSQSFRWETRGSRRSSSRRRSRCWKLRAAADDRSD